MQSLPPLEEEIEKILLFAGLSTSERRQFLPNVFHEQYKPNDTIIDADHGSTDVFFILEGEVEISVRTRAGQKVYFQRVREGEYFGEFSAIDGEPRSAAVLAVKATRLFRMQQQTFIGLLILHPRTAMQLMRRLVAMIRNSNAKIVDIATLTVMERLYKYFITKGTRSGVHQVCVRSIPSQSDLAAEIGATRETVSRAINKMITDQVIMRGDEGVLYIRDNAIIKDLVSSKPRTRN